MIFLEGALADRDLWLFSVRLNWFQASRFCLFSVAWLGSTKDIHCFFESEKRGIIFPMAWKQTLHRAPVPLISIRLIWNEHKTWRLFQHLYSFFFSFFSVYLLQSSFSHSPDPHLPSRRKIIVIQWANWEQLPCVSILFSVLCHRLQKSTFRYIQTLI